MPQDIPLEASETLAFVPESLGGLDAAPSFVLRSPTTRDKRFHRRLIFEEGLVRHSDDALRDEVRATLRTQWDQETYDRQVATVDTYWDAIDGWNAELTEYGKAISELRERGDDDALKALAAPQFGFDPELAEAVELLLRRCEKASPRLREMKADNDEFAQMSFPLMVAVTVKSWTNLDAPVVRDSGYLTVESAAAVAEALARREAANGLPEGVAWTELAVACTNRMYLSEDSAKNFASPSRSGTPPEVSTTALADPGPSPESTPLPASPKNSAKTPQPA